MEKIMKIKIFLLILLSFIILSSCKNNFQVDRKTIIHGKIENPQSNEIAIILFDNIVSGNSSSVNTKLNKNGEYKFVLKINKPQYVLLSRAQSNHPIFLFPGDSLKIKLDDLNINETLGFQGNGAFCNEFLSEYHKKYSLGNYYSSMRDLNPDDYKRFISEIQKKKIKLYNSYLSKHDFRKEFKLYASSMIKYEYYLLLFNYRLFHAYCYASR
jgi:hypothetical protein